jgi:hypothetical protein
MPVALRQGAAVCVRRQAGPVRPSRIGWQVLLMLARDGDRSPVTRPYRLVCKAEVSVFARSGIIGGLRLAAPVVFLELPVVILFALYPGLFSLSQLAR